MVIISPGEKKRLLKKKRKLLDEISKLPLVIRGSYFERFSTCSRPDCSCHKGFKHGPRGYVITRGNRGQIQHYVRKGQIESVKRGIEQYHRMLSIADQLTEINMKLMRGGCFDEQGP